MIQPQKSTRVIVYYDHLTYHFDDARSAALFLLAKDASKSRVFVEIPMTPNMSKMERLMLAAMGGPTP